MVDLWVVYSNDKEYGGTSYVEIIEIFNSEIKAIECIAELLTDEYENIIKDDENFLSDMIRNKRFDGLNCDAEWSDVLKFLKRELIRDGCCSISLTEYAYDSVEYSKNNYHFNN